jgi:hypothetical protein
MQMETYVTYVKVIPRNLLGRSEKRTKVGVTTEIRNGNLHDKSLRVFTSAHFLCE